VSSFWSEKGYEARLTKPDEGSMPGPAEGGLNIHHIFEGFIYVFMGGLNPPSH
jgi:hypothetical protein